jgi:hypothetical protein
MDNFDLQKFLTENKLTRNSRLLKEDMDVTDGEYVNTSAAVGFH